MTTEPHGNDSPTSPAAQRPNTKVETRRVIEWAVRYADGRVESYGTTPSGTIEAFTEDIARYIAGPPRLGRAVVRRTKTVTTETTDWEEVTP